MASLSLNLYEYNKCIKSRIKTKNIFILREANNDIGLIRFLCVYQLLSRFITRVGHRCHTDNRIIYSSSIMCR